MCVYFVTHVNFNKDEFPFKNIDFYLPLFLFAFGRFRFTSLPSSIFLVHPFFFLLVFNLALDLVMCVYCLLLSGRVKLNIYLNQANNFMCTTVIVTIWKCASKWYSHLLSFFLFSYPLYALAATLLPSLLGPINYKSGN